MGGGSRPCEARSRTTPGHVGVVPGQVSRTAKREAMSLESSGSAGALSSPGIDGPGDRTRATGGVAPPRMGLELVLAAHDPAHDVRREAPRREEARLLRPLAGIGRDLAELALP